MSKYRRQLNACVVCGVAALWLLGALACTDTNPAPLSDNPRSAMSTDTRLTYTPVRPCRIVDTRKAGVAIAPSGARNYIVHGEVAAQGGHVGGCPSPVGEPAAVQLNITVMSQVGSGHLRAYPYGTSAPLASIINFKNGNHRVSNAAIVKTCPGCAKDISIFSSGNADVIIDVLGYFSANAEPSSNSEQDYVYTPVSPCRIIDTREAGGVFAPGDKRPYAVYGDVAAQGGNPKGCPSPRGEPRAVHVSLTAVPRSGSATGSFSAFAANTAPPDAALLHYKESAQNIANAAIVKTLHDPGKKDLNISNEGAGAHLVVDVLGYYHANTTASAPSDRDYTYVAVTPCRIMDSRKAGGPFEPHEKRKIVTRGNVASQGGHSSGCASPVGEPRAAHINVTAVPRSGKGHVVVYEADRSIPTASALNYDAASQNVANALTVKTAHGNATPDLEITNRRGQTDIVIDVLGYFVAVNAGSTADGGVDAGGSPDAGGPPDALALGVAGRAFTVDSAPTFLLAVSYYGGTSASEATIRSDLQALAALGFNNLRVWASWPMPSLATSVVQGDGSIDEDNLARLEYLIATARQHGMTVDVTFAWGWGGLDYDFATYEQVVGELARRLRGHRNVLFDLCNEHAVPPWHTYMTVEQVDRLARATRAEDPQRLVTASYVPTPGHNATTGENAGIYAAELLAGADLDFVAPHFPRDATWPTLDAQALATMYNYLPGQGFNQPIHLQEPARRQFQGADFPKSDFLTAVAKARAAGAAGWCFHTEAAFDLTTSTFFDNLDAVERDTIDELAAAAGM